MALSVKKCLRKSYLRKMQSLGEMHIPIGHAHGIYSACLSGHYCIYFCVGGEMSSMKCLGVWDALGEAMGVGLEPLFY